MKPLIVATNDDGVAAEGLRILAEAVAGLGDVIVCAPSEERSGSSHAITFHTHLRAEPVREGVFQVSGTPVDCTYLAMHKLCGRWPDLVVSGINNGYNLGSDVFYSGTVGAAAEGFLRGVSAIAVSAERGDDPTFAQPLIRRVASRLLESGTRQFLNINLPPGGGNGEVEITRLGARKYMDSVESRTDPHGREYYWIGGPPTRGDDREGDDTYAVAHGRVSITPLEMDITAPDFGAAKQLLEE